MLVGHGRAGKDCAGEYLESVTHMKFAGTTSKFLAKYVAQRLGRDEADVYATRHQDRQLWFDIGNELRRDNPGLLIHEALAVGDITGGIRDIEEIVYARESGVADLIIWIENNRVPKDPTVKFTSREADIIIENNWDLPEFYMRLRRLANALGILRPVTIKDMAYCNGVPLGLLKSEPITFPRQEFPELVIQAPYYTYGVMHEADCPVRH